jgi:hypothetical protein
MTWADIVQWAKTTALAVLDDAGISQADLIRTPTAMLRERVPQGSAADVALAVYALATLAGGPMFDRGPDGRLTLIEVGLMRSQSEGVEQVWVPDGFAPEHGSWEPGRDVEAEWIAEWDRRKLDAASLSSALAFDLGHRLAVLQSMISQHGSAAVGRKRRADALSAADEAAQRAREVVDEKYGLLAQQVARDMRSADSRCSKAKIARALRQRWPELTGRSAQGNLPEDDRAIVNYLTAKGF